MSSGSSRRNQHLLTTIALVFLAALWLGMGTPRSIRPEPKAIGFWTTEKGQVSVLECHNPTRTSVRFLVNIFDRTGKPLGAREFKALPLETVRLSLEKTISGTSAAGDYGSFDLEQLLRPKDKLRPEVTCKTLVSYFQPPAQRQRTDLEFAYELPVLDVAQGIRSGIALSQATEKKGSTPNFLMVYNKGPAALAGTIELMDESETVAPTTSLDVNVAPGGVGLYALNESVQSDSAPGTYRLVPKADGAAYGVIRPQ